MRKVFLNKETGLEIHDPKGEKTIDDIKKEYGDGVYDQIDLSSTETATVKDNKLEKYDHVKWAEDEINEKKIKKEASVTRIKSKLNLTDEDFKDLVTAVKS